MKMEQVVAEGRKIVGNIIREIEERAGITGKIRAIFFFRER